MHEYWAVLAWGPVLILESQLQKHNIAQAKEFHQFCDWIKGTVDRKYTHVQDSASFLTTFNKVLSLIARKRKVVEIFYIKQSVFGGFDEEISLRPGKRGSQYNISIQVLKHQVIIWLAFVSNIYNNTSNKIINLPLQYWTMLCSIVFLLILCSWNGNERPS